MTSSYEVVLIIENVRTKLKSQLVKAKKLLDDGLNNKIGLNERWRKGHYVKVCVMGIKEKEIPIAS